jgi:hypothetical protein
MCRGQGGALLFSAVGEGDGEGTCADYTAGRYPQRDAEQENLWFSPFRTFPHDRAVGSGNKKPQPKPGLSLV